jgi:hypothetical protein
MDDLKTAATATNVDETKTFVDFSPLLAASFINTANSH